MRRPLHAEVPAQMPALALLAAVAVFAGFVLARYDGAAPVPVDVAPVPGCPAGNAHPVATWAAAVAEPCPPTDDLVVDGRGFSRAGKPFFWLADSAWSLLPNLTRAETEAYLDTRAEQGFTVVAAAAVVGRPGGAASDQYGDAPYRTGLDDPASTTGGAEGDDAGELAYDYWDHVDFVVGQAARRGLVLALAPVRADDAGGPLDVTNARAYGEFLGARYAGASNVVWVLGGPAADGADPVWPLLADGIRAGGATQLMTFRPPAGQTSAGSFPAAHLLGFHELAGGQCLRYPDRAGLIGRTYAAGGPFVDGEPIYEDHPYCMRPADGYASALDVRRDAYWSVLGGAAGHTYGHHAVWQFLAEGRSPVTEGSLAGPSIDTEGSLAGPSIDTEGSLAGPSIDTEGSLAGPSIDEAARGDWTGALRAPGAEQMGHLRALVESRPRVEPAAVVAEPGEGAGRIQSAVAPGVATLMVYTAEGRPVTVDIGVLSGNQAQPWWYDPRTGAALRLEVVDATATGGRATFSPPSSEGDTADWVLVVDDTAAEYGPPGAATLSGRGAPAVSEPDSTGASGRDLDEPGAGFGPPG